MSLKSRAEVQLVQALNDQQHKTAASTAAASSFLSHQQQRAHTDTDDDYGDIDDNGEYDDVIRPSDQDASYRQHIRSTKPRSGAHDDTAAMVAQVRELQDDYYVVGAATNDVSRTHTQSSQIEANAVARREQHMSALQHYTEQVQHISDDMETALIRAADSVKDALAQIDTQLFAASKTLEDDAQLLHASSSDMDALWRNAMLAPCTIRTQRIDAFATELDALEDTRLARVRVALTALTTALMTIAHALPPEVERILEREAFAINTVVLTNRQVYADLIARIATADVTVLVDARAAFERGLRHWRHLHHDAALAAFQTRVASSEFVDPFERRAVLAELRLHQQTLHTTERLDVLTQLEAQGAALTCATAQRVLERVQAAQAMDAAATRAFVTQLEALHAVNVRDGIALREALRLELHGFGALALEGDIDACRDTLAAALQTDSAALDALFRTAGGLRSELESVVKRLQLAELVDTTAHLTPLVATLDVLCSALPLARVMDASGKSSERKALLATLDKLRQAHKHEIPSLLSVLQAQLSVLHSLVGMDSDNDAAFQHELQEVSKQLDALVVDSADSSDVDIDATANESSSSTASVDLHAVRRVQRRLGTLVFASELPHSIQQHVVSIAAQLTLQQHANAVVDTVIASACDPLLASRTQASECFVATLAAALEHQNAQLHDQTERLASFALQLAQCLAQRVERIRYIDLSALDALDALQDDSTEWLAAFEVQYVDRCARLRHAPTDRALQSELHAAADLLQQIEREYRLCHDCVGVAAERHAVAIETHRRVVLEHVCRLFGLVVAVDRRREEDDAVIDAAALDVDTFLSAVDIETVVRPLPSPSSASLVPSSSDAAAGERSSSVDSAENPQDSVAGDTSRMTPRSELTPAATPAATPATTARSVSRPTTVASSRTVTAADDDDAMPLFSASSGLEASIATSIPELVTQLLSAHDADTDAEGTDAAAIEAAALQSSDNEGATAAGATAPPPPSSSASEALPTDELDADALAALAATATAQQDARDRVATEFLTLELPLVAVASLLTTLRDAFVSQLDTDAQTTAQTTRALQTKRLAAAGATLEEQLRMHWPRTGRLDVQLFQPRRSELVSHRQREERQLRAVVQKADAQERSFAALVVSATERATSVRTKQLACFAQLPMQTSLAALQGLESKSKKLLSTFRAESDDVRAALQTQSAADSAALTTGLQDLVRSCASHVFPDVTSCDVISGCDYHNDEVSALRDRIATVETQLQARIHARNERDVAALVQAQSDVLALAQTFAARYASCMQTLSMADGLGQTYGRPRRTAQERYRTEVTRCDARAAAIDALLTSLDALVAQCHTTTAVLTTSTTSSSSSRPQNAKTIVQLLLQLRAKLFARGRYFGLLVNVSQLAPTPIEWRVLAGATGDESDAVVVMRDADVVDEQDQRAAATSLLLFDTVVADVAAQCRTETRALFEREGKLDELPPGASAVPPSLDAYLTSLADKARSYKQQQALAFRDQVHRFSELIATAPACALRDVLYCATQSLQLTGATLKQALACELDVLLAQKHAHTVALRPELCSPNNVGALQALNDREATRSQATIAQLQRVRTQLLQHYVAATSAFERELIALARCLFAVLDTSILTLDDLAPLEGDDALPTHMRKSLKRLRKAARIQELGDVREVKRTDIELQRLTQLGETPRFSRRAWPSIPAFGAHAVWAARQTQLLAHDEQHALPRNDALVAIECSAFAVADSGACVGLLTHAHRSLVTARDTVYATFESTCTEQYSALVDPIQEQLRDERKGLEQWQQGIATMQREQQ